MRNISEVIDQIVEQIPSDFSFVIRELRRIQTGAEYTAPEAMSSKWLELSQSLNSYLPYPPETIWQEEILLIVRGEK